MNLLHNSERHSQTFSSYDGGGVSHRHLHLDGGVWVVVTDLKVLCLEVVNGFHFPPDVQRWESPNLPLQLHVYTQESNMEQNKDRT